MSNIIISMAIAALGFSGGWVFNGWRLGAELQTIHATHAKERAEKAEAYSQRRAALTQGRDALADRLHQADQTHTAQLQKARHENKSLADRIAAGSVGLRIDATCTSAGAGQAQSAESGSVDSPAGAQLTPTAGRAYSALRDSITTTEVTLQACQGALSELQ